MDLLALKFSAQQQKHGELEQLEIFPGKFPEMESSGIPEFLHDNTLYTNYTALFVS